MAAMIWDFESSPLFSDADFADLARHFSREQQVEIVAVVALYGFFNRWNDTMATSMEETRRQFAKNHLSPHGWTIGKHR